MSYTQLIKDTLNILDLNIYFEENCLTKERYKGQVCLIYKGTLQYTPEECPHCLCVVDDGNRSSEKYFHFFGLSCHEEILRPIEPFQTDFTKGLML